MSDETLVSEVQIRGVKLRRCSGNEINWKDDVWRESWNGSDQEKKKKKYREVENRKTLRGHVDVLNRPTLQAVFVSYGKGNLPRAGLV